jgi:hypothetical protein
MAMVAENKAKLDVTTDPVKVTDVKVTDVKVTDVKVTDVKVTDVKVTDVTEIATAVLAADPATGLVDVVYIGPNDDVTDRRFLLLLFGGEKAFLFDRDAGRTISVEPDDRGLTGEDRLRAKLDSAMAIAARERLAKLYVVKHP